MATQKETINCVAFDCGNSSFRTMLGRYDGKRLSMEVVDKVPHNAIEVNGLYYWDILKIFDGLKQGLKKANCIVKKIDSIGICTWGIDFGFIDQNGFLLANPLSYRNPIGEKELSALSDVERRWMFDQTGIQNHRMNSIYQLQGIKHIMPELLGIADRFLLIPDLLNYLFTGAAHSEFSIASTTQILDVRTKQYSQNVMDRFGYDKEFFPTLMSHGSVIGNLRTSISEELRIPSCKVICVPSHDTACAVTAVPAKEEDFIFISSGTWSLIGTELEEPLISELVYDRDFTNEGGVLGTITLLRNSTGMHILQGIKKELKVEGQEYSWDGLIRIARNYDGKMSFFDPNSSTLFNPKSMISAIKELIRSVDGSLGQVLASSFASLAYTYRSTIEQIEEITGKTYPSIYIVGGGSQNMFLNQLTADFTGKSVISGPTEATSYGNIGVQLMDKIEGFGLKDIRDLVRQSETIHTILPDPERDNSEIESQYLEFRKCI
jgi:sugar (pentulose or hexulose) kinase